ncbi:UNVERIFIED_CONTAM: hypothetical protein PYX00_002663 [Menopon gallinae]|uniref:Group XIIA secretory phospholipase A2 n=1 Tax=Menopon gallinae TaxID=328185 RepID=A0AAW2HXJ3_9NEOP
MELPKVKILIYILTFLGYAWSGYGSGILVNLRDAILSAENFFGDFLGNLVEFGKRFKHVPDIFDAALDEKCKFSCPSGLEPVKNRYHKPSANGCGTDLLKFDMKQYIPTTELTQCCNNHDICYDTCNSKKEDCDADFHKCLYRLCDNIGINSESILKACKATAKLMSTSTMSLGCKSYLESQTKACYCPPENKKKRYATGNEL